MTTFQYYTLNPPTQWKAGSSGETPLYYDCGDCGAEEPKIAGFLASEPTFWHIAILEDGKGFPKAAMFCEACFQKRLAQLEPQAV